MAASVRRVAGAVAGVLRVIGLAIVTVLVVHIVLTLLDANAANAFATFVRNLATILNLGLTDLFNQGDPKLQVLLNFGVAALIWLVITLVVVRLVRRIG